MPYNISLEGLQSMLAQNTNETFLECVTITPPSGETVYLVNDGVALVRTINAVQVTFIAAAFELSLQTDTDEEMPTATIRVNIVDQQLIEIVRGISGEDLEVSIEVVTKSDPNTVQAGPFEFTTRSAEWDDVLMTLTLGFHERLLSAMFPKDLFSPTNAENA